MMQEKGVSKMTQGVGNQPLHGCAPSNVRLPPARWGSRVQRTPDGASERMRIKKHRSRLRPVVGVGG